MENSKMVPELGVTNLGKSLEFYKTCGAKIDYERPEKKFVFLAIEGNQIMLEELREEVSDRFDVGKLEYPFGRGLHFQIEVKDAGKILTALEKKKYKIKAKIIDNWFRADDKLIGMRNFLVQDPDGYLLMFYEDLGTKPLG